MKRIWSCIALVLFTTGVSCKKPTEIEGISEPPLPPEGCQIVKTIYKTRAPFIGKFDIVDPESITLDDGQSVQVATLSTTTYAYDQLGRLIEQMEKTPSGNYLLTRNKYEKGKLVEYFETGGPNTTSLGQTRLISLNDDGLQTQFTSDGRSLYVYNADKQLLRTAPERPLIQYTYQAGNRISEIRFATWVSQDGQWVPTAYQHRRTEFNLQQPNIPTIYQYLGADSRNLPIKEILEMKSSSQFGDGPVYQKIFTYLFDKRGLVRRRVANGKSLNPGWLLEDDAYGVGVIDYEYRCP